MEVGFGTCIMNDLRPQIIIFSIARVHLERIKFVPQTNWNVIFRIAKTSSGKSRSKPYDISTRWYYVEGERAMFIFGRAAQLPFGLISADQKRQAGKLVLEAYRNG